MAMYSTADSRASCRSRSVAAASGGSIGGTWSASHSATLALSPAWTSPLGGKLSFQLGRRRVRTRSSCG
jgi:hypothetical protein